LQKRGAGPPGKKGLGFADHPGQQGGKAEQQEKVQEQFEHHGSLFKIQN
jgi:hypothetical protein